MAQDFPEDKLDYRPTPQVRTFAEQVLHATAATAVFTSLAQGIKPTSFHEVEKPSREKYKTRAQIVEYIQKTFADGAALIQKYGDKGLLELVDSPFGNGKMTQASAFTFAIGHLYDHYGQCVVSYRLNGLLPPASRNPMWEFEAGLPCTSAAVLAPTPKRKSAPHRRHACSNPRAEP